MGAVADGNIRGAASNAMKGPESSEPGIRGLRRLGKSMKKFLNFSDPSSAGLHRRTNSAFELRKKSTPPEDPQTEEESDQLRVFRQRLANSVAACKTAQNFSETKARIRFGSDSLNLDPGRKREFESPVHQAVAAGNLEELHRLLASEGACDVDVFDGRDTPLHLAAKAGDLRFVQLLLLKGASVDKADHEGWNALHHASLEGHGHIVRQLLQSGAKITEATEDGMSPLHCAVHLKNCIHSRESTQASLEVINELAKWWHAAPRHRGTDINARDYQGWTALHMAVQNGSLALVKELLDLGADPSALDNKGATPMTYAPMARGLYHQNKDMQELLRSHAELARKTAEQSKEEEELKSDVDLAAEAVAQQTQHTVGDSSLTLISSNPPRHRRTHSRLKPQGPPRPRWVG